MAVILAISAHQNNEHFRPGVCRCQGCSPKVACSAGRGRGKIGRLFGRATPKSAQHQELRPFGPWIPWPGEVNESPMGAETHKRRTSLCHCGRVSAERGRPSRGRRVRAGKDWGGGFAQFTRRVVNSKRAADRWPRSGSRTCLGAVEGGVLDKMARISDFRRGLAWLPSPPKELTTPLSAMKMRERIAAFRRSNTC